MLGASFGGRATPLIPAEFIPMGIRIANIHEQHVPGNTECTLFYLIPMTVFESREMNSLPQEGQAVRGKLRTGFWVSYLIYLLSI